ncbi:hypothetical protein PAXRUDRAFT_588309 [Paxillus rubicundulus Ve08.2h10]|uniref:Uncharacterized protein n=1 Tax=Paxillus rubicundulus Ve08.2h10 TaxID=930991 RepID=A0A0D0DTW1_9AGAM|nr:hypothetical protein PAXRUDRAFT_588309 [Paxillus rubicundulus Ve08.2h10]
MTVSSGNADGPRPVKFNSVSQNETKVASYHIPCRASRTSSLHRRWVCTMPIVYTNEGITSRRVRVSSLHLYGLSKPSPGALGRSPSRSIRSTLPKCWTLPYWQPGGGEGLERKLTACLHNRVDNGQGTE